MESSNSPALKVPARQIIALEHPMIVKNLDNGIKTFGRSHPFQRIFDSRDAKDIIPLYLRYDDPMCTPILSHNCATNNLLLKITIPKRTGRKRKRGSQDPFSDVPVEETPQEKDTDGNHEVENEQPKVQSHSRLDRPSSLLRRLQDTKGSYKLEVAGQIMQSHRYRGVSDFQHSLSNTEFMPKFRDATLARDAKQLREFKFNPSKGWKPNEDFVPAPIMTLQQLPFNWGFHQNPNIFTEIDEATGQKKLVNRQGGKKVKLEYLGQDVDSIPMIPPKTLPDDPRLLGMIEDLRQALEERPLYTRRALVNRVGLSKDLWMFRDAIQYVGYQFKGGPFRDAVIKLGVDPRSDPKYRQYQTFFFKLFEEEEKVEGMQWKDVRTSYSINRKGATKEDRDSHIFDGKTVILDGKIWQGCDITDPLLSRIIRDSPYRDTCDNVSDGWFPPGTMAKIRAIMKTKLMAVCCRRELTDEDFAAALLIPDFVPKKKSKAISIPVPKVGFTNEEIEEMRKQGLTKAVQTSAKSLRNKKSNESKARSARIRPHVGGTHTPRPRKKNILSKPSPTPTASDAPAPWSPTAPAPSHAANDQPGWVPIAPAAAAGAENQIAWRSIAPAPTSGQSSQTAWRSIAPAPMPNHIGPSSWAPIAPAPIPRASAPPPDQDGDLNLHPSLRGSSADRPFTPEKEALDGTLRTSTEDVIMEDDENDEEIYDEDDRSDDEGTDVEQEEISDGAASDVDSEATDVVDYRLMYNPNPAGQ